MKNFIDFVDFVVTLFFTSLCFTALRSGKVSQSTFRGKTKWIWEKSLKEIDWIYLYFNSEWFDLRCNWNMCTLPRKKTLVAEVGWKMTIIFDAVPESPNVKSQSLKWPMFHVTKQNNAGHKFCCCYTHKGLRNNTNFVVFPQKRDLQSNKKIL